jgi:hypothetical protein
MSVEDDFIRSIVVSVLEKIGSEKRYKQDIIDNHFEKSLIILDN